ncbi:MAG: hypothetical protein RIC56_17400 [Pseudomonadales bacterium]
MGLPLRFGQPVVAHRESIRRETEFRESAPERPELRGFRIAGSRYQIANGETADPRSDSHHPTDGLVTENEWVFDTGQRQLTPDQMAIRAGADGTEQMLAQNLIVAGLRCRQIAYLETTRFGDDGGPHRTPTHLTIRHQIGPAAGDPA